MCWLQHHPTLEPPHLITTPCVFSLFIDMNLWREGSDQCDLPCFLTLSDDADGLMVQKSELPNCKEANKMRGQLQRHLTKVSTSAKPLMKNTAMRWNQSRQNQLNDSGFEEQNVASNWEYKLWRCTVIWKNGGKCKIERNEYAT